MRPADKSNSELLEIEDSRLESQDLPWCLCLILGPRNTLPRPCRHSIPAVAWRPTLYSAEGGETRFGGVRLSGYWGSAGDDPFNRKSVGPAVILRYKRSSFYFTL